MKAYHWDIIPEDSPRPGVRRRAIRSSNALVVRNEMDPGMQTFPHRHDCEQLVMIEKGRVLFHVGDEVHTLGPGSVCVIPPGVLHYADPVGPETVVNIDVFAPVRQDYLHLVAYQEEKF